MHVFLLVLATVALCGAEQAPLLADNVEHTLPGEYIVVFHENTTGETVDKHHVILSNLMDFYKTEDNRVMYKYSIHQFQGYASKMNDRILGRIRGMPEVKYIERNQIMRTQQLQCIVQTNAPWGLERVCERDLKQDMKYDHSTVCQGQDIDNYIIDTGIDIKHTEFEGRASFAYNAVDGDDIDGHGHGTHVAGTVAGVTYGVAKQAKVLAVKVLDNNGFGSTAGVIKGIEYVAGSGRRGKSLANMSLGGGYSSAMNAAIQEAVTQFGIAFIVAAGNENSDSCSRSPASSEYCTTVGASDSSDTIASFSNYGDCAEIIAPGVDVLSAIPGDKAATFSGTSMASPHVAGVASIYLSCSPTTLTPQDLEDLLIEMSTKGTVNLKGKNIPNRLAFVDCATAQESVEFFLNKSKTI